MFPDVMQMTTNYCVSYTLFPDIGPDKLMDDVIVP